MKSVEFQFVTSSPDSEPIKKQILESTGSPAIVLIVFVGNATIS